MRTGISTFSGLWLLAVNAAAVTPVTPDGGAIWGTITSADREYMPPTDPRSGPDYHRDVYSFEAQSGDVIEIAIEAEFHFHIALFDPQQVRLAHDSGAQTPQRGHIRQATSASGTHHVVVTTLSPRATGAYVMTIHNLGSRPPATPEPVSPPPSLSGGPTGASPAVAVAAEVHEGRLEPGDEPPLPPGIPRAEPGHLRDVYTYEVRDGETLTVELECEFDGYLYLIDSRGQLIAENNDYGNMRAARIANAVIPEAGECWIVVTTYGAGQQGAYRLSIGALSAAPTDTPIAPGQTIEGTLEPGDEAPLPGALTSGHAPMLVAHRHNGHFRDGFTVTAQPGDTLEARVEATFDTYLYIFGPDGRVAAWNDNSGGTRNSMIDLSVEQSGVHRIIVTSYAPQTGGPYTLTLSAQP